MNNANYDRGVEALAVNDAHEAVECFTRAIADDSRHAESFRQRALAHLMLNNRPKALLDYDAAVRLKPNQAPYRRERAAELFKQKRYADCLEECLVLEDLVILQGRCRAALGDATGALADFEAAGAGELKAALLAELAAFDEHPV